MVLKGDSAHRADDGTVYDVRDDRDYDDRRGTTRSDDNRPTLLRWGAIVGGAVIGLGLLMVLSTLWSALAYDSGVDAIADNIEWFLGASAVFALFVGGYLAGVISGVRGFFPGLLQGLTMWGAILITSVIAGVSSALNLVDQNSGALLQAGTGADTTAQAADQAAQQAANVTETGAPLWATFLTLVITAIAAVLGGVLGGASPRAEGMFKRGEADAETSRRTSR